MFFLVVFWSIVAISLLAVDVIGSVRKVGQRRNRWGRAMIWAFALGVILFAIFWLTL
jgi:hypothetical protein